MVGGFFGNGGPTLVFLSKRMLAQFVWHHCVNKINEYIILYIASPTTDSQLYGLKPLYMFTQTRACNMIEWVQTPQLLHQPWVFQG